MPQEIMTIVTKSNMGSVNGYLVKTGEGCILIDTGYSTARADLERQLAGAGCQPGNLRLIILTHGDLDHTSNAAYMRNRYGAKIAMHAGDAGMTERGDMSLNRKPKPIISALLKRMPAFFRVISLFSRSSIYEGFRPDFTIDERFDLSAYGFDGQVIYLPGHSKGSIGILTADGSLFCGDLLDNTKKPALNSIMDDLEAARSSVEKLRHLDVKTVYPGHGKPFPLSSLTIPN